MELVTLHNLWPYEHYFYIFQIRMPVKIVFVSYYILQSNGLTVLLSDGGRQLDIPDNLLGPQQKSCLRYTNTVGLDKMH